MAMGSKVRCDYFSPSSSSSSDLQVESRERSQGKPRISDGHGSDVHEPRREA